MAWREWHPVVLGLLGTLFTWGVTALGAALVLVTSSVNELVLDFAFGSAAGVMVAASCFGLLIPALQMSEVDLGKSWSWIPASIGFAIAFVFFHWFETWLDGQVDHDDDGDHLLAMVKDVESGVDKKKRKGRRNSDATLNAYTNSADELARRNAGAAAVGGGSGHDGAVRRRNLDHEYDDAYSGYGSDADDGSRSTGPGASGSGRSRGRSAKSAKRNWNRTVLLLSAITVHNFPEGMAVGVAFGAASACETSGDKASCVHSNFGSAVALTIGIAIQNFPEGMAVSFPLRQSGMGMWRCLWYGQLSGLVEPIGAIIGATATTMVRGLLPYSLGFAAGAMIYVVIAELIPETHAKGKYAAMITNYGFLAGFLVMMVLDVALG